MENHSALLYSTDRHHPNPQPLLSHSLKDHRHFGEKREQLLVWF